MAIGTTWTSVSSGRLVTAGQAWIDSRVQWRRVNTNRFEFRLQINVNNSLFASAATVWFTANGQSSSLAASISIPTTTSGWQTVGPVWVRTAAQVGSQFQITNLGCQIRFATWSLIFQNQQIGNDRWWVARTEANIAVESNIRWVRWGNTYVRALNQYVRW